jgi:diguanylate cyclase (GGDEF)-like protein/PAS domain S-box-containing protein
MSRQQILIIDDSPDVHDLVRVWLSGEAVDFTSSFSGDEALDVAASLLPDLVLLDVDMPGLDGFEVCRRLKANPATSDIPVVFLTGAAGTDEKLRGLELGASDYLIKPFDPAELRARVRTSLQTKRLMDLLAQKALVLQESEERFRVLAENSSDVISRHTPDGCCLYVSPACFAILGYTADQLLSRSIYDFIHPEDAAGIRAGYSEPRGAGETATVQYRFRRQDGRFIWLESTLRVLTDERSGSVREIHASARDIGARKQMENREQIRAQILAMIAEGLPLNDVLRRLIEAAEEQEPDCIAAGVMIIAGVVHHYAPNLPAPMSALVERQLYHFVSRFSELADQTGEQILFCDLMNDPAWEDVRASVAQNRMRSCWAVLVHSRHREANGAFVLYRCDQQRPRRSAVEMMKLASSLISVALEHRELTDQLTFQAHHDALTHLPNRTLFSDRLDQALTTANRTKRAAAVLVVDLDRFKYVNDTFGHQAGDELLCQVSRRLQKRLRASDTLARMGGDEFAVILTDLAAPNDAEHVATALVQEFKRPVDLRGREVFITISVGAVIYPRDGVDGLSLMKNADLALYHAKDGGRNSACLFTPELSAGIMARLDMESALRQALANSEFLLHYQPKVNAAGRLVSLEALARWQHPQLGMIPPSKFIPLAEETGMILPFGAWVLREAARQARAWIDAGLPAIPIAVNVSALQFAQPDFLDTISSALDAADLQQPWLELELTESLLMKNMHDAADKLALLKEMGVRVAIDDFGTGYSSLAYLQRLSLDTLKIDISFVNSMDSGPAHNSGRMIIGAIVALAKSLGLNVVAEGVETEAQRQFLVRVGCDLLQGYLFGPPVSAQQIEQAIRKQLTAPAIALAPTG